MIVYFLVGMVATILLFGFSFLFEDEWRGYLRWAALGAIVIAGCLIWERLNSGVPY